MLTLRCIRPLRFAALAAVVTTAAACATPTAGFAPITVTAAEPAPAMKVAKVIDAVPPPAVVSRLQAIAQRVYFEVDSAMLLTESNGALDEVAKTLSKYAKGTIEIQGHTDNTGSRAHNERLSQSRAEAVRDYLVGKGVPAPRLIARGFGDKKPRTANDSDKGRRQNRRVEFHVVVEVAVANKGG